MGYATVSNSGSGTVLGEQRPGAYDWQQLAAYQEALIAMLFPVPPAGLALQAPSREDLAEAALYFELCATLHLAALMATGQRPANQP